MRIISWTWFLYVIIGFLLGGGAMYLYVYLKDKAVRMKWYELLTTAILFFGFVIMAQTFIGSYNEGVPRAAWLTVAFMGVPMAIVTAGLVRLLHDRIVAKET